MPPLAHHINLFTSIPGNIVLGAAFTLLFLPIPILAFTLAYFIRRPWGVAVGTLVALSTVIAITYGYTCWTCDDHTLERRFIDPVAGLTGGLLMSYAVARFGASRRNKDGEERRDADEATT